MRSRQGDENDVLAGCDDNRNGRIPCTEARRHGIALVHRSHQAYRHMRDGDGDGVVCEQAGGVTHMSPNRVVFERLLQMRGC